MNITLFARTTNDIRVEGFSHHVECRLTVLAVRDQLEGTVHIHDYNLHTIIA